MADCGHARLRVKMTRNFGLASCRARLVAQSHAFDLKLGAPFALAKCGRFRIVVSADPYPFLCKPAQSRQGILVRLRHAFTGARIMKAVTETDDAARPVSLDRSFKPKERVVAVERGNEPAARSSSRPFFQMQV